MYRLRPSTLGWLRGLGRSEDIFWYYDLSSCLPEDFEPSTVFPLRALDTNFVCQHPGPLDAQVCGPHQSDVDPTLDVYARPRVGLSPLCCVATGYHFWVIRRLHPQKPVDRGNKGREKSTLFEASLQVNLLLRPLRLL